MPYYRVYHLGREARFASVDDAECLDDDAALVFARAHLRGRPLELWNLARCVATLGADGAESAAPPLDRDAPT